MPLALGRNVMKNLHAPPPVLSNVGAFSRRCSFKDFSIPWASSRKCNNYSNCHVSNQVEKVKYAVNIVTISTLANILVIIVIISTVILLICTAFSSITVI